jgi:phosphatidylglycerol:prolipoprotein diacylglycerol transferase
MYPYELFFGLDLYTILITVGVVACLLLLRLQGDWRDLRAKHQNFLLTLVPLAVILGYVAAVLIQGLYNIAALGEYRIDAATGSTFFGGLLGGVVVFLSLYFGVGHFRFHDGYHKTHFRDLLDLAPACITVAHGFGRLGCLMAGCCHGARTDAWYGVETIYPGYRVVPIQLFEALFLFALTGVLLFLMKRGLRHQMPIYMLGYGAWRFLIEYARADDRGETIVSFLSPSQLFALLLMLGGVALLGVEMYLDRRAKVQGGDYA